jgi:Domain of unknown function (DUF4388)
MSLVGSLEDLGLADILQIVSLSRKSGMLVLRSESGDGRIVLRDGLVQGASIKGEPDDLRSLLVARGGVEAADFDRARGAVASESLQLDEALRRECGLPPERLASLRRERVERSVMRMFGWRTGEFSFEIREELTAEDRELLLPAGLNSQYLAMEATRLGDEISHAGGATEPSPLGDLDGGDVEEPVFSGEETSADPAPLPAAAVDVVALGAAQQSGPEPESEAADAPAEVVVASRAAGPTPVAVSVLGESGARSASAGYLVAIDSDLSSLEWLKASLDGTCRRVHIFQHREAGLERIRQHLMRGIVPTVVVSELGHNSRIEPAQSFIQRLRALAPAIPILALRPEHVGDGAAGDGFDGAVIRPSSPSADPKRWHLYRALAERLRNELAPWLRGEHKTSARRRALDRLKGVSERLRDPATQGEVLTLVLDFAAEAFSRVAMFMVRDEVAVGMAQRGLPPTGGPDDAALRAMELGPGALPELFEEVLAQRSARRRGMRGELDRRFAIRLGAATPREAYAAPIESGGRVVALIYADNLPDEQPLPDTTAFEIVLHEAGLVLDRAVLERALAERR